MKTVLILGISADIGREMCERYLADGYRVIGTYRNRNGNVDMAESAEDVTLLQCDITSVDDIQKVRDAFREQRITWDVLFTSIGASTPIGRFFDQWAGDDADCCFGLLYGRPRR